MQFGCARRAGRFTVALFLPLVLFALAVAGGDAAAGRGELAEFDAAVRAELAAVAPAQLPLFDRASAADADGRSAEALALYTELNAALPTFDLALRRRCTLLDHAGARDEALPLCRAAVAERRTVANLAALGQFLINAEDFGAVVGEINGLIRELYTLDPDDSEGPELRAFLALRLEDVPGLQLALTDLHRVAPHDATTAYFAAIVAASHERWDAMRGHVGRFLVVGGNVETAERLLAFVEENEPVTARALPVLGVVMAVWAGALVLLFLVGLALSRATLRVAREVPADPNAPVQGRAATVRRVYRRVLWLACAYYYLSLPLVLIVVVALGGSLLYLMFMSGHVSAKVTLFLGFVVVVTVGALLRSFFRRASHGESVPGFDLSAHPRFRSLLDEVAVAVGTRAVDVVHLTPGVDMAVFEEGTVAQRMRGHESRRVLLVGAGLLDGLSVRQLRSILAHEYGHFSNRDTAGGDFALAVDRAVLTSARSLAEAGAADWYNPAWLFLRGFHAVFTRISRGASRLQEVLADRWSAFLYGSETFVSSFTATVRADVAFGAHANATLTEVRERNLPLENLYRFSPSAPPPAEDLEAAVSSALDARPSAYDSHPAPRERFAFVRRLAVAAPDDGPDAPAWSLFEDPEAVQRALTATVRANIAASGARPIAGTEEEAALLAKGGFEDLDGTEGAASVDAPAAEGEAKAS